MGNRKRYPYSKRLKLVKEGSGAENIDDKVVKSGRVIVLTGVSVEDVTSALDRVRIGKHNGSYFHPWEEALEPEAGELSFSQEEQWIREGEHFRAVLTGGDAEDVCWVYLEGYWMRSDSKEP